MLDRQRETRFVLERVLLMAYCYDESYLQAVSVGQLKHQLCGGFIVERHRKCQAYIFISVLVITVTCQCIRCSVPRLKG